MPKGTVEALCLAVSKLEVIGCIVRAGRSVMHAKSSVFARPAELPRWKGAALCFDFLTKISPFTPACTEEHPLFANLVNGIR